MHGNPPDGYDRRRVGFTRQQGEGTVAIDITTLTKGQVRKLNALRKSVGDALGEKVFGKWLARQAQASAARRADPVAEKIAKALAAFEDDPKFRLGRYGYTIRRARGRGASGLVAAKNAKA